MPVIELLSKINITWLHHLGFSGAHFSQSARTTPGPHNPRPGMVRAFSFLPFGRCYLVYCSRPAHAINARSIPRSYCFASPAGAFGSAVSLRSQLTPGTPCGLSPRGASAPAGGLADKNLTSSREKSLAALAHSVSKKTFPHSLARLFDLSNF